ncbi:HAD hydrolase-like protein, partial [Salmonella enterica]|uniref:HAD hydrolase-like protein n=1 Tax=Salmonella enterica TaxID=28901 RepID=UPI00122DA29D
MGDDGAMPEHGCQPPRAGYRLLIFDFDGTLADTFPFFLRTMDVLADEFGFRRIGAHEVDGLRGCGARQMLRHVGLPLWKMPRVAARFIQLMSARIDEVACSTASTACCPGWPRMAASWRWSPPT